ncbi:hypothetical protein, partial [Staphylococcus aureus]
GVSLGGTTTNAGGNFNFVFGHEAECNINTTTANTADQPQNFSTAKVAACFNATTRGNNHIDAYYTVNPFQGTSGHEKANYGFFN